MPDLPSPLIRLPIAVGLADEDVSGEDVDSTFTETLPTGNGTSLPKIWTNYLRFHISAGDKGLFLFEPSINKYILINVICTSVAP